MRGLTREQIEANRAAVVAELTAAGHEIVDSFVADETPTGNAALDCLGKSFQIIAQADAVYFMEGWEQARGCKMEYAACRAYGIAILPNPHIGRESQELSEEISKLVAQWSVSVGKWKVGLTTDISGILQFSPRWYDISIMLLQFWRDQGSPPLPEIQGIEKTRWKPPCDKG
jgi:hypothetical protein